MSRLTNKIINENKPSHWVELRSITQKNRISDQYIDICEKHALDNKWILLINPEDQSLAQLSEQHRIDTGKILKVNTTKTPVNMNNIKSALCKGNCSAVVLCNPCLQQNEIEELQAYARIGKTTCVVLNSSKTLH